MALVWTATGNPTPIYNNYANNPVTFSAVPIGAASADRVVIVGIVDKEGISVPADAVTIAGSTATKILSSVYSANDCISLYRLGVASGTTANIVVTTGGLCHSIGILVGILTGANPVPTATATQAMASVDDPLALSTNPTIPSGGVGVIFWGASEVGGLTYAWTNATQDYGLDRGGNGPTVSLARSTTAGSWNPSVDGQAWITQGLVAAAWEPAVASGRNPVAMGFVLE